MSCTGWRSTGRFAGRSAGRLLVLVAALASLFAMHGLSEHGVMHHDMASMSSMTTDAMSAVSIAPIEDTAAETLAAAVDASSRALDQDGGMAMALCLAILSGLVVLLLRSRGLRTGALLRLVTEPAETMAWTSRDTDPPDLLVLSIQRC